MRIQFPFQRQPNRLTSGFSRPQFLFMVCLAVMAFEIGTRMAEDKPAIVRKTSVLQTNVVVPAIVTNVSNVWPAEKEKPTPGVTNVYPPDNYRPVVKPTERTPEQRQMGGGTQMPGVNPKGPLDKRKVQGSSKPRIPASSDQSPYGIRIALP